MRQCQTKDSDIREPTDLHMGQHFSSELINRPQWQQWVISLTITAKIKELKQKDKGLAFEPLLHLA